MTNLAAQPNVTAGRLAPPFDCYQALFEEMAAKMFVNPGIGSTPSGIAGPPGPVGQAGKTPVITFDDVNGQIAVPADSLTFTVTNPVSNQAIQAIVWSLLGAPGVTYELAYSGNTAVFTFSDETPAGATLTYFTRVVNISYEDSPPS